MISSVFELPGFIKSLPTKDKALFDSMFSVEEEKVAMGYDSKEAKRYLQKVFKREEALAHRHTISITNHVFEQQTLFSPIRSTRPITTKGNKNMIEPSKDTCDFCDARKKTPADSFGRIETTHTITAANAGPYTGLHSLIIPKSIHNPLEIPEEVFLDMLGVANEWIQKAHQYNPNALFPSIIWNVSGRAGASIFHPHIQVFLTEKPFEKQAVLYKNMLEHQKQHKRPFFDEFSKILKILNLAKTADKITVAISLTPVKDKEIFIISEKNDRPLPYHFSIKTYSVITQYIQLLGVTNFNFAIAFPPLDNSWHNFPVFIRMVDRGMDGRPSDIAAMEFFFASVVSTDPYSLLSLL